jgi:hypothetical protein
MMLTQVVPQSFVFAGQVAVQLPPLQSSPAGHGMKQPPQCRASVFVATQMPPHSRAPTAAPADPPQLATQLPFTQMSPGWQVFPQLPQFVAEVMKSTHPSSGQGDRPAPRQELPQVPFAQTSARGHCMKQPPQLYRSDLMSA